MAFDGLGWIGKGTRRGCSRAVQKRPLVKAALFSADVDDFARVALLRAYEKESRLIVAVDHIAWRRAQRSGPSGLRGHRADGDEISQLKARNDVQRIGSQI
jgi:hypothetical protein